MSLAGAMKTMMPRAAAAMTEAGTKDMTAMGVGDALKSDMGMYKSKLAESSEFAPKSELQPMPMMGGEAMQPFNSAAPGQSFKQRYGFGI